MNEYMIQIFVRIADHGLVDHSEECKRERGGCICDKEQLEKEIYEILQEH